MICFLVGCDLLPGGDNPGNLNNDVTITFYDGNTIIKTVNGKKGDDFPIESYEKEGYTFVGWDLNNDGNPDEMPIAITSNVSLRAILVKIQEFKYVFAYNGEAVEEKVVPKGTRVDSYDLKIASDNDYTYKLLGWYTENPDVPVSFPYEINSNTVFYPIIERNQRTFEYTIYDGEEIIRKEIGLYNSEINYPELNSKLINNEYYVFCGWTYENANGDTIDEAYLDTLTQDLIIKANYTNNQVLTVIIDEMVVSSIVNEGEILQLKYGKPTKDKKVVWYIDSSYSTKLTDNKMINGSLIIYGKYEDIEEIDSSILEIDYNEVTTVRSEYEFLLLFNSLLLNKVNSKQVTLEFEYTSLDELFDYITKNALNIRNYNFSVNYEGQKLNLNITYEEKGGLVSENTVYKQLSSFNIRQNDKTRPDEFNQFPIDNSEKSYKVIDSESLYYVLEHGYKPIIDPSNISLNDLYNKMRNILKNIINDDMDDFTKAKSIYEWLVMNITYDKEVLDISLQNPKDVNKYNAFLLEGVFNDGKAVCDGISKAFSALANIEGIKCVRVTGASTTSSENHAWNKILINGVWYIVDATSGGVIMLGDKEVLTYEFFLISSSTFNKYYIDDNELYSFIETNYDYDSYSNIFVNVNDEECCINFMSREAAKKIFINFLNSNLKTFNFRLGYFESNDDTNIENELFAIMYECNMVVDFNYTINDDIFTVIKND